MGSILLTTKAKRLFLPLKLRIRNMCCFQALYTFIDMLELYIHFIKYQHKVIAQSYWHEFDWPSSQHCVYVIFCVLQKMNRKKKISFIPAFELDYFLSNINIFSPQCASCFGLVIIRQFSRHFIVRACPSISRRPTSPFLLLRFSNFCVLWL